jgi:16S rRNA (cytosine967-C5)-methyltransferase
VQDVAASLPAQVLGEVTGGRVVELGAAPGGKTMQLAAAGARVTAVELAEARAELLRANLARTRLEAEIVVADATEWRPTSPAPFVLLDAPCTSTGTIRRHPDVQRAKGPADIARMAQLQEALLAAAAEMTAPGGRLVYAVCSLQPEEGPAIVDRLLARRQDFAIDPVASSELGGLGLTPMPQGTVRTLPSDLGERGGMDGFFIARLRRLG